MLIISGGGGGAAMGSIDGYVFTTVVLIVSAGGGGGDSTIETTLQTYAHSGLNKSLRALGLYGAGSNPQMNSILMRM